MLEPERVPGICQASNGSELLGGSCGQRAQPAALPRRRDRNRGGRGRRRVVRTGGDRRRRERQIGRQRPAQPARHPALHDAPRHGQLAGRRTQGAALARPRRVHGGRAVLAVRVDPEAVPGRAGPRRAAGDREPRWARRRLRRQRLARGLQGEPRVRRRVGPEVHRAGLVRPPVHRGAVQADRRADERGRRDGAGPRPSVLLPHRLRQGRPAPDRGGEREPDHDRRRDADHTALERGHA